MNTVLTSRSVICLPYWSGLFLGTKGCLLSLHLPRRVINNSDYVKKIIQMGMYPKKKTKKQSIISPKQNKTIKEDWRRAVIRLAASSPLLPNSQPTVTKRLLLSWTNARPKGAASKANKRLKREKICLICSRPMIYRYVWICYFFFPPHIQDS